MAISLEQDTPITRNLHCLNCSIDLQEDGEWHNREMEVKITDNLMADLKKEITPKFSIFYT